jgi:hypothetical protein
MDFLLATPEILTQGKLKIFDLCLFRFMLKFFIFFMTMHFLRKILSKHEFPYFIPGTCFFSAGSAFFPVYSKKLPIWYVSRSRRSDDLSGSMRPYLVLNLGTPHWSEEELSFVFEQFALARNHTIIRLE